MPKKMRIALWIVALLLLLAAFATDTMVPLVEDSTVLHIR